MRLNLKTPPTEEPVSVQEARNWLLGPEEAEDPTVQSCIAAARELYEENQNVQLVSATYILYVDRFPRSGEVLMAHDGWGFVDSQFVLPRAPLSSVTSIKYLDGDGAEQTVAAVDYFVDTDTSPGRIRLEFDKSWPVARNHEDTVYVEFVAGYGDREFVPESHKRNVLQLATIFYQNRGEEAAVEKASDWLTSTLWSQRRRIL